MRPHDRLSASIEPLADAGDAAAIADWIWQEWARHEPGVDRAQCEASVHAGLQGMPLPRFYVARAGDAPIGCASIVAADLPTEPGLGPWLANVYVRPAWRGRGLGTRLVETAMAYGAGVAGTLYLYTFGTTALYERLGWQPHATGHYAGRPIAIMRWNAAAPR